MRYILCWIRTPKHDNSFRLSPRSVEVPFPDPLEEGGTFRLDPVRGLPAAPITGPRQADLNWYV